MSFRFDVMSREIRLAAQHGVKYGIETALYYKQAWSQLPKIDNSWQLFKPRFPTPFVQFVEEALRAKR